MPNVSGTFTAHGDSNFSGVLMAAVNAVATWGGNSFAAFTSPSLNAAWTADLLAGELSGLAPGFQSLPAAFRDQGVLVPVLTFSKVASVDPTLPACVVLRAGVPGQAGSFSNAALSAALLGMVAKYGNGPIYTLGSRGLAAVTGVRKSSNSITGAPYSVEISANPIQNPPTLFLAAA